MQKTLTKLTMALAISSAVGVANAATLEEVVVVAQKRAQSLQDVPVSVAAVDAEKIADAGIVDLQGLSDYVPNFSINETGISNAITVRGISSGINPGFEQSVGMYNDGIFYGRDQLARIPMFDMERVEILRGPQGILWIDKYKPDAQTSNSGLKSLNGHVLSADILYDLNYQWAFGGRLALRKAQETITGMSETNSITWLTALNARRYFDDQTWASAEYRMRNSSLTNDQKDGLAVEIGSRFGNDMEFAVGYNWAGYNTDLADLDYNIDEFQMRLSYILE